MSPDCFHSLEHINFAMLDDLLDARVCSAVDSSSRLAITEKKVSFSKVNDIYIFNESSEIVKYGLFPVNQQQQKEIPRNARISRQVMPFRGNFFCC